MHHANLLEDQPIAWTPTPEVIERAQLTKFMRQVGVATWDELYQFSIKDVEKFTEEVLKFLDIKFDPPYEKLLDTSNGVEFPNWFLRNADAPVRNECRLGTKNQQISDQAGVPTTASPDEPAIADEGVRVPTAGLNITEMCLDRWQTDEMKDQPAVIWEGEEGSEEKISYGDFSFPEFIRELTYGDLFREVEICSEGLRKFGFDKGDAIGIHLPMMVETVIALLAINRIGAIAVPVFSGYGVDAIASRLNAVVAKALFTCDQFPRRGKKVEALGVAIDAVANTPSIEHVFVVPRRKYDDFDRKDSRLVDFAELFAEGVGVPQTECKVSKTAAEDPLIILYTSGTTGKPKGIAHTHASFPIKAAQDMAFGTDVGRGTRICWYTDIGWMMGPWLIYGALINGATICIYDGAPDYPTPDRMWEFCAKHKVEILGISPTLIRSLASHEAEPPAGGRAPEEHPTPQNLETRPPAHAGGSAPYQRHDLSSLRAFASTGEPWNPAPWWWLFEKVGDSKLPIINYSGGTEIAGGILMGNPLLPIKPCSFPAPCPGMDVDILDEDGNSVEPGKVGELVIKQPWIGMARGFWQEKERYLETYWSRFKNIWVHGDWAMRDADGHWFILGRSDDTLKVAGKRVGPAEVESLLVAHPLVTEAAVIGVPDEVKGTAMVAFCVLAGNADTLVRNEGEAQKGWHERGFLPHYDGEASQFVTFRLFDSLPQNVFHRLKRELEDNKLSDVSKEYRMRVEEYLDQGIGACFLKDPMIAEIVREAILFEHKKSCRVIAWVVMPNHVHLLLRPLEGHSLSDIMKRIKGISARRINEKLNRTGSVWQPDYFDRYIRDEVHFAKTIRYIANNPVKAGLCSSPDLWKFSSASVRNADTLVRDEHEMRTAASPQAAIADKSVRVPLETELKSLVAKDMGKPLAPSKIHFVSALPKTRNAKVMRRVIRAAYLGEDPGDLSALENPHAVDEIRNLKN